MRFQIIFLVISIILFVSCVNSIKEENIENNKNVVIEKTIDQNQGIDGVSFSKDIQPLLDHDCIGCHEYLESRVSYTMLTTHNSTSIGNAQYINVNNPTESYFYIKLKDEPPCGSSMGGKWTNEEIDLVLKWIEEGAKNN